MRNIMNVFGRSPFVPLQMHMEKVSVCVDKIPGILAAYKERDAASVESIAKKISKLEHEADNIKHDIRRNLPKGLFMPVSRSNILTILDIQDKIANKSENLGVLLTFKQADYFDGFEAVFDAFLGNCLSTFYASRDVIDRLDELLETGFGGHEADTVLRLIDVVALKEHEADVSQRELIRALLLHEDTVSYGDFFLWTRVIRQLGGIADSADRLGAAVRVMLETN